MTKKYFSVDVSNDIHIVNLHKTEEQAKKSCLDCAIEAYEFANDLDDFENYVEHDLPYAVYGVVLGRAKSDIRPLTDDELESGHYDEQSYIIEPPELIKVNRWISVDDRLPQKTKEYSFYDSDDVLCYGKEDPDDENHIFIAHHMDGNGFYSNNGSCYKVTHWQPLPEPPKED